MKKIFKYDQIKCWQKCGGTKLSYTAGGSVDSYSHLGKIFGLILKCMPNDPASIHTRGNGTYTHQGKCTRIVIAAKIPNSKKT